MTTHAVQNTMMHRISSRGSWYRGPARMINQRERKATLKKCMNRMDGLLINPARSPHGPSIIPSWK